MLALGVAVVVAVCAYLYLRLDDEIRRYSEQLLANHYTDLRVQVASARYLQGRGIAIYDLTLSDPQAEEAHQKIMHIDELHLLGEFDTRDILSCAPTVDRLLVKRPQLFVRRARDGTWNMERLLPLPKFGDCALPIQVDHLTLVLSDEEKPQALPLVVRDVDLRFHQVVHEPNAPPKWQIFVGAGRPLAEKMEFSGDFDPSTGKFDANGTVTQLEVTPELLAALPLDGLDATAGIELHGRVDFELEAHRAAGDAAPPNWRIKDFRLSGGRVTHPRLPRRIGEIEASGQGDQDGLSLTTCTGRYGETEVALACRRLGWHATAPLALRARAVDLPLDAQLESALPPSLRRWWDRFRPAGTVTATLDLTFDGHKWLPDATVQCHQVSFEDQEKFRYRLQNATGTLSYFDTGTPNGAELTFNLRPTMQNQTVHVTGHFAGLPTLATLSAANPLPTGILEISCERVSAHAELIDALPLKVGEVLRTLNPGGDFSFTWKAERKAPYQAVMETELTLDLLDCSFRYNHFPYPLSHVTGRVQAQGKHWTFQDLVSRDERSGQLVRGSGSLTPNDAGWSLQFTLHGDSVPLDNNLRNSLSPELQQLWMQLKPQGRINFTAQVTNDIGRQQKPAIELMLSDDDRSVSLEPEFFPYRLEQLSGRVHVSPEKHVVLQNIRARHGDTELFTQGSWQPLSSGGWEFRLHDLHVDRLTPGHDVIAAVPSNLAAVLEQLKPEGNFAIESGELTFTRPSPHESRLDTQWDIILDCQQSNIHAGLPIEDISGSVRLIGGNVGGQCSTVGELKIDSLVWQNLQFTGIQGPMWCDHSQCLFGHGATQKLGHPPRSVVAQICGGAVAVNGNVMYDGYPRYGLNATVRDIDLAQFATEHLTGQGDLRGRVHGDLRLQGNGTSLYGLAGDGRLTAVDASLYELPLLVSLLKVLRNRAPDTTAFNRVESQFRIHGDRVTLQKLDLLGDAVSFYGRGDAWFNKRVDLAFHAIIGRNDLTLPVLRTFVGQASEQFLQLAVDGTLDDPQTHAKAFPGVSNMLEQLQSDLQGPQLPAAQRGALPATR